MSEDQQAVDVETTIDTEAAVAAQQTGLADIAPEPTRQHPGAQPVKPFTANPKFAAMARKLRGAQG